MHRGETTTLALTGRQIGDATGVFFDDPQLRGTIVPAADPAKEPNRLQVRVEIGRRARVGGHRVYLNTPRGTTGAASFAVGAWTDVPEREPNNEPGAAPVVELPATVTGAMEKTGDVDCFRFQARAGEEMVFEVVTAPIRSRLNAVLRLRDAAGKVVAETADLAGRPENLLGYRFPADGTYALEIRDFEDAAGGDVSYRLNAGPLPYVHSFFPLGVQAGTTTEVEVSGFGLNGLKPLKVTAPAYTGRDQTLPLPLPPGTEAINRPTLMVGQDPEVIEGVGEENDSPATARTVPVPVTVNGRVHTAGGTDADHYRFAARKGQPLILEVQARRLGSPLDSVIDVLDAQGNPVERATLRCLGQTVTTLNDRDSANPGIRLLAWNDFRVRDLLYMRGELLRIAALPRGPDDDARFEAFRGQRLGMLDTTPHGLSNETPVYKVRVYPPGTQFPPNGMPVIRLNYQNDDGGPLYGKDSRLTFTPSADGDYVVRIRDVRGEGGERYAYRLGIHPPRPDFRLTMSPEHPNVPRGAAVPVDVTAERFDDFEGAIQVRLEGLPPGFQAEPTTIDAGQATAAFTVSAAPDAPPPSAETWGKVRLVGRATINGQEVVRAIEPERGVRLLTALPEPDVTLTSASPTLTIRPGQETRITVTIARHHGFAGRVPINVQNLPYGVRILDVGLNGVLITEQETSREFTLYAEPWVRPQSRSIFPTATVESDPQMQVAASTVTLTVAGR